ncbi:MAG: DMT family transporter [Candidatus Micrarchaeota archaeon]|nr:DMT family transporter [Candidatus Micrarchaeota archaeon]
MTFLPIITGLLAAFFWGTSDYLVGKPSRAIGQWRATTYVLGFSAIVLLLVSLYTGIGTKADASVILLAALSSIVAFLAFLFAFRAFRYGDLTITAPIVGTYPAIAAIGAVFILGETISGPEAAAIAAIIAGIVLLSTRLSALRRRKKIVASGIGSAILSMLFFGGTAIFAGAYAVVIGVVLLSLMWRSISAGIGFVAGYATRQDVSVPQRKYLPSIVMAGITDAFGVLAFVYGIVASSTLPIVASLAGFAGGVTAIYAFALLKERPEPSQWLGILLAVAGVVVLSYIA